MNARAREDKRNKECEYCGATLDPGERCDCRKARKEAPIMRNQGEKQHEIFTHQILRRAGS